MNREQTMEAKYGGKEALKKKRQEWQRKSRENPNVQKGAHRGWFKILKEEDPQRLSEISKDAIRKRYQT